MNIKAATLFRKPSVWGSRFGRAVLILVLTNFVVFVAIAGYLGGDAINGRHVGERYYLSMYGRETEVSEAIYLYSGWHAWLTLLSWGIAVVINFANERSHRRRSEYGDVKPPNSSLEQSRDT